MIEIGPLPARDCDHRWKAKGHDPGVMLRHLTEVRHATCTGPGCRRPAANFDFEHNTPTKQTAAPACAMATRHAAATTG